MSDAKTLKVAHDFTCPWCLIGFRQAKELALEFGLTIDWRGYELWPEELAWPEPSNAAPAPENKPKTPSRFEFFRLLEGEPPILPDRPKRVRTRLAHLAVEHAKAFGTQDALVEAYYKAHWEAGLRLDDEDVVVRLALPHVPDPAALIASLRNKVGLDQVVMFDDDAYASGVYNVPTFFIGDARYAEQPTSVLREALQNLTHPA
ncbi:MAG: DsbA family protein [Armatimonadetes bacterium]|nr:DsbA family protein [Armatimonadota bacterium]